MEHLVETPVRGVVYEGTQAGEEIVRNASRTWRIPVRILPRPSQPAYSAGTDGLAEEVRAVLAGEPK
jgi:hypothetical protein